jgi:glycosyltransferase involved in cell wall biosynthesis
MKFDYSISIIVPAYNAEETLFECLKKISNEEKNLTSEIIVIDDNSVDNTSEIAKKFNSVKLVKLKKNRGVGFARNMGARLAKNKTICYVDSDLIISEGSIENLVKKLYENPNIGCVGAIQEVANLNQKEWSSNFVCAKSCYGFEDVDKEKEFSAIQSEFCVIDKMFLKKVGGWKSFRGAGGEEYELGYKINKFKKRIIIIKNASYKTYYVNLYLRFLKIIDRTEKYLHVFLTTKRFDSMGAFATGNQAFSSFLTLSIVSVIVLNFIFNIHFFKEILTLIFILQLMTEVKFLTFVKKYFGFKILFFSLLGIQIINLGILLGVIYFIFNNINFFLKKIKGFFI